MMRKVLDGKLALVVGGSGGIGQAVAAHLSEAGCAVCIVGRTRSGLSSALARLHNTGHKEIIGLCCEVGDFSRVKQAIRQAVNALGDLDILVNAAGIQAPIGEFVNTDINKWSRNLQVNLMGTVYSCKVALPFLEKRGGGSIINFSGGGATSSRARFSAYAVAKTGIVRFTEVLAEEVRGKMIRVNAIAPGAVNTRMLDEVLLLGEKAGKKELSEAKQRAKVGGVSAGLAADLVVFLASRQAAGLTGKLISAVWDPWKTWDPAAIKEIMNCDKYSLRRLS
jgi:3-oxoacyl-[acyl-carrier protein] reductase